MRIERPTPRRASAAAFAIISMLLAARLFVPAAALTFSRQSAAEFAATGLPAWSRLALALPEMLGAVLFSVPRTFYVGASVLVLDLAGAIVAHLSLGIQPIGLYLLLAAVSLLAVTRAFLSS
jgi:hypothetical protein